jgi:UPF0042 nucleotide-binding protein
MRIVVVTGISGSGKSTSLRALEDIGFYAIDNLPVALLDKLIALSASSEVEKLALVVDARVQGDLRNVPQVIEDSRRLGHEVSVLFLDADDAAVERRYSETRRRHPLSKDGSVLEGISRERALLDPLREVATITVDTTAMSVHELKQEVQGGLAQSTTPRLEVIVSSFGFRHGIPTHADLVFDVRFLPNPHFVEALRPKTGLDPAVSAYVLEGEDTQAFLARLLPLLEYLLPSYEREGKAHLNVAVGCTGGQHRSVALAVHLARFIEDQGFSVRVRHRDIPGSTGSLPPPPRSLGPTRSP